MKNDSRSLPRTANTKQKEIGKSNTLWRLGHIYYET
jgi:hypothetical protein